MSRPVCRFLLAALLTIGASVQAAPGGDAPAATASTGQECPCAPATTSQLPTVKYDRALPFMAEEALSRGYEIPLPFGAALIVTGLGNREIDVTDVRVGVRDPPQSVSQFVHLGSSSDVFNANVKFDAWLLPFLNVYALVGYVKNESTTHALITVPQPGPLPGTLEFEKDIKTNLDGFLGGVGVTLAGGYKDFFLVADASYVQTDLGFDNDFTALIATIRAGWQGKLGNQKLQIWFGVGNWDTAATATGHVDLENVGTLDFEADQKPHTPWMYDIGTNLEFSKKWQLVLDAGFDFNGGYVFVVGPTYRF